VELGEVEGEGGDEDGGIRGSEREYMLHRTRVDPGCLSCHV
jgi:hypothetical protein